MKKELAATITCLMVLITTILSFSQATPKGKFDVRLKLKSTDCANKKVVLQVQVKAHDANTTFKMGDANFRFDFDPLVVNNPKNISQENFSSAAPASDANYNAQSMTGTQVDKTGTKGIVSLNVIYSGSNLGAKDVGVDYITVACIQFDIVKGDGCVNYAWHKTNATTDFPITGMNEIIAIASNPYDYVNPNVPTGGLFEDLNICLNQYCGNPPKAVNDYNTTPVSTPVSGNVSTNDNPASGLTVKTTPAINPLHGSIIFAANGNYTYTPATGYVGKDSAQYETCDVSNQCAKAWVIITIIDSTPKLVDLELTKTIDNKKPALGSFVNYTITVTNKSSNNATGVSVKDYFPTDGAAIDSYVASVGIFDPVYGNWTIGTVPANSSVTLTIKAKVLAQGVYFNKAEVWTCNETDSDSKPGSLGTSTNPNAEDDIASTCFSVPINLCSGELFDLTVPAGYTNIQWYKDDVLVAGATSATYRVTTPGHYRFTTYEGNCPATGCCDAVFVLIDCCKPDICVPYKVTKTKTAKK